jgi:phage gp16-like protein
MALHQSLADVENPRLARIKERTLWWQFKILHTPGKKQLAGDAISRRNQLPAALYKVSVTELADDEEDILALLRLARGKVISVMKSLAGDAISSRNKLPAALYKVSVTELADDEEDILAVLRLARGKVISVMKSDDIKVISWDRLYKATQEDPVMVHLAEMVYRGFPQRSYDVDEGLKPYYQFIHDLHVVGGVVCYKDRVIIPTILRTKVLDAIHAAHQGVNGMVSRVDN